jgi:hypothetical protein
MSNFPIDGSTGKSSKRQGYLAPTIQEQAGRNIIKPTRTPADLLESIPIPE